MKEFIRRGTSRLKMFLKIHGVACLLAILVGTTSIAPHLLAQNALGADYQGFPLLFQSNEDYYLARVQEIIDGHWLVSSPYIYEYKNSLSLVFPVGEYLYALPSLMFGVSVLSILMATKFIFPALLFLLVYILLYNLSGRAKGDKITASFGGLLITLGIHFVNYKSTWAILTGQSSDLFLSMWTRPVNPITGALFLFIFLILLWRSIRSNKWYWPIAAGAVLGLMPGYIFSWMVALAVLGAYGILLLVRRRLAIIKKIFFIIFCSLLIGIPSYYLWFQSLYAVGDGQHAASRNGLMLTHYPILNKVVLAQTIFFLAIFLFERRRKKKNNEKIEEWWWFAAALVFGNWLVYNQQIITGRVVWPAHLTQYTIPTAFLTFVLILGNYFKTCVPKLWSAVIVGGCSIIVLFLAMTIPNYRAETGELVAIQRFMPFFGWLNSNAPKDCVVLAKETISSGILSRWVPAFTHCNTYSSAYALAPPERLYFNYIVSLRLQGVKRQNLEQYLWDHKTDLRPYFYETWPQLFAPTDDSWLAGPIQVLIDQYDSLLKEDFATALKRYRVDYLASEEPLSASLVEQFSRARLMGKFGLVYVYQLR
ncbi:hypothetical protein KJ784_04290 [Patescibacteria group bacterium]|nr:hypothetical protein [Patescibacteria group bacterium]